MGDRPSRLCHFARVADGLGVGEQDVGWLFPEKNRLYNFGNQEYNN